MKTEAQKRATNKWIEKTLAPISVRVRKEIKAAWVEEAARRGMSLAAFITEAVDEKIERG